jgi:glutamyl-Q tRNA(Asp) synthetase
MQWDAIVKTIEARLQGAPALTRFAPSPTGYLHLGHVVNALYVWGIARALDGKVILRLENHDRTRCKQEYEEALLQDLEWLDLIPDLGKPDQFRKGTCEYRQSDCEAHYQAALQELTEKGFVYACDCSRKRIQARQENYHQDNTSQAPDHREPGKPPLSTPPATDELRYDGFCRDRNLPFTPNSTLRLKLPDQPVTFEDIVLGPQTQYPANDIGDMAIRDNHGHWTYQFAVVVDDIRQGINLIIRGMDILSSTGRQILLAEMLGQDKRPIYLHHPLLVDASGKKLSKREFSADIHHLMMSGKPANEVLEEAASRAGLSQIPAL